MMKDEGGEDISFLFILHPSDFILVATRLFDSFTQTIPKEGANCAVHKRLLPSVLQQRKRILATLNG